MPMPNRFLTSLLIKYKGRNILIDCGEGTQVSMKILKWGFKSIDIICITHRHGDHILGLPGLLSTMGNSGRTDPVTIIGPKGIESIIEGLKLAVPNIPFHLNIIEVSKGSLAIETTPRGLNLQKLNSRNYSNELIISMLELEHSVPCIGYNFYVLRKPKFNVDEAISKGIPKELWKELQSGKMVMDGERRFEPDMVLGGKRKGIKLSYIMDTRPMEAIVKFIKDSDLFICEGTYGSDKEIDRAKKYKHMTFREAAELAYKGEVEELLLAHFGPAMADPELYINNARAIFPNTVIGYDRFIKSISFGSD